VLGETANQIHGRLGQTDLRWPSHVVPAIFIGFGDGQTFTRIANQDGLQREIEMSERM
jgi:hypothetical protein